MIEVHEMQVFLAAAEEENFSAAGRALHLSQPAISFQIQGLEKRLKTQLFQRTGRRIALTEAGRELLPMARELIGLAARIEEDLCASQGQVKGHVTIGCTSSPGKYILPLLVGAYRRHFPDVQFTVDVMTRQIAEERLIDKQIHIGVLSIVSKRKELECWPLMVDALALIVSAAHPWAARDEILAAELKDADWILRESGAATRQVIFEHLAEFGIAERDLRISMEFGSVEGIETAVEAGHGVSIVSRIAALRDLKIGRIKAVKVKGLNVSRQIFLARNRLRTCTCAQLRFREFIASEEGQQIVASVAG